jgi:uncharacterized protein (TIGR02231 family)
VDDPRQPAAEPAQQAPAQQTPDQQPPDQQAPDQQAPDRQAPDQQAPIVAVTVYPDRARVTRRLAVELPPGEHRLQIGPLPLGLHRDSLRVSAGAGPSGGPEGHGAITVLGVDVLTSYAARTDDAIVADLTERRRELVAALAGLDDADEVEASREAFVARLARRAGGTYAQALAAGQTDTAAVAAFADSIAGQLAAGRARRSDLTRRRELARDRLAAVDRRLAGLGEDRRAPDRLLAEITVLAGDGGAGLDLDLAYVVDGAGWRSSYDVRLDDDGAGPVLTLTWYGLVSQRTGEDWPECDLRLSTARPAVAATVPELEPWFLDRVRPLPVPPPAMTRGRAIQPTGFAAPAVVLGAAQSDLALAEVAESVATVEQGVAAATYRPARPVAVPADGAAHRATVAALELPAELDHVTAPVRAPEAHLRAVVVNDSPHTLLPGRAAVFHGGDFVGATELPTWAPGEEVELALGVDDRIRVEREMIRRSASRAALRDLRRRDVEHRITVANHTPHPARVTVLDQAPVSRDEGITVRETAVDPAPAERTDLGVLTWRLDLEPGQRREITLAVRVELARGVELTGWRE